MATARTRRLPGRRREGNDGGRLLDTNLDGSFEDEMPLHDYRQGRETIALGTRPVTLVANFADRLRARRPAPRRGSTLLRHLGAWTHVTGIAAGHNLFNVAGFDGVAPGRRSSASRSRTTRVAAFTVHASMWRAMDYAARFAAQRNLPLVLTSASASATSMKGGL